MADIAELGFKVDSDPLQKAADRLDKLSPAADRAERATDRFNDTTGKGRRSLDGLAAGAGTVTTALARMAAGFAAAFSVSQLISLTNTWTDLNSRVEIASGSIGQGTVVMGRLADMARRTYSSLELTAEGYLRNATAMRQLGYSTNETLDYVEAINNALVVSGAKGDRAASVMDALGKAMALGKLSGDQLEIVLASGGRVAEALADSLGVTTLELRKLGADGKLTGDILQEGLTSQLEKLRAEADAMPATIGDAFVLLGNSILQMVGQFDQASGASSNLATMIIAFADAMNNGTISVERILSVMIAFAAFMAGSWVVSFVAANGAVGALTLGLTALRGAMIRTGIGALIVLAGELIYELYEITKGSKSVADGFGRIKNSAVDTFERVMSAAGSLVAYMSGVAQSIRASFLNAWADILQNFIGMMNSIMGTGNQLSMSLAQPWIDTMNGATAATDEATASFASAGEKWSEVFEDKNRTDEIGAGAGAFDDMAASIGKATVAGGGLGPVMDSAGGAAAKAADQYGDAVAGAQEFIQTQAMEAQALGMSSVQANTMRYAQELLNKATANGATLTAAQRNELMGLAAQMAETEDRTANLTEAYNFGQQTFSSFLSTFRQDLMSGTSLWGAFANAAIGALDSIANRALEMAANGIWDMLFGSIMSGFTGGMGGGMKGTSSITGSSGGFFPGFASGGFTGGSEGAAAGIVHGQEYVLNAQATRSIGVSTLNAMNDNGAVPSNDNGGGFQYNDQRSYDFSGSAMTRDEIEEIMENDRNALLADMPNIIQSYSADPRKRKAR